MPYISNQGYFPHPAIPPNVEIHRSTVVRFLFGNGLSTLADSVPYHQMLKYTEVWIYHKSPLVNKNLKISTICYCMMKLLWSFNKLLFQITNIFIIVALLFINFSDPVTMLEKAKFNLPSAQEVSTGRKVQSSKFKMCKFYHHPLQSNSSILIFKSGLPSSQEISTRRKVKSWKFMMKFPIHWVNQRPLSGVCLTSLSNHNHHHCVVVKSTSVTLDCQINKIIMNSNFQLSW